MPITLSEGQTYRTVATVTNRSMRAGLPVAVDFDIAFNVGSASRSYLSTVIRQAFGAGEMRDVSVEFTVPAGEAGQTGAIVAQVRPPSSMTLIREGSLAFSVAVVGRPITPEMAIPDPIVIPVAHPLEICDELLELFVANDFGARYVALRQEMADIIRPKLTVPVTFEAGLMRDVQVRALLRFEADTQINSYRKILRPGEVLPVPWGVTITRIFAGAERWVVWGYPFTILPGEAGTFDTVAQLFLGTGGLPTRLESGVIVITYAPQLPEGVWPVKIDVVSTMYPGTPEAPGTAYPPHIVYEKTVTRRVTWA